MKHVLKLTLVLAAAFCTMLCTSCSTNVTGGPGTGAETTNGIVVSSSQTPLEDALVLAIDAKNWVDNSNNNLPVILDSTRTSAAAKNLTL